MLLIHTALHAEARLLIEHYGLKRQHNERAFACFASHDTDNPVWLIESGIGKAITAAAVGWLSARVDTMNPVWLNVGIAGHADLPLAALCRAQRIEDHASSKRWYPTDVFTDSPPGHNLLSVDQPLTNYPEDLLVDMESSGFVLAANRFTTLELIQSLKIISDNREHPVRRFKTKEVDTLIAPHIEPITRYANQLVQLRTQISDSTNVEYQMFLRRWHFSQYQQATLRRLLQRHAALLPEQGDLLGQLPDSLKQAKAVLKHIEDQLDQTVMRY